MHSYLFSNFLLVHKNGYSYSGKLILIPLKSSLPEVFLGKDALKICGKFTGEHPCPSAISIKFQSTFVEITLRHGCSPVSLLHNFRTTFYKNTSGWLLLTSEPIWQHYGSSSEWSRYTGSTGILLMKEYFYFITFNNLRVQPWNYDTPWYNKTETIAKVYKTFKMPCVFKTLSPVREPKGCSGSFMETLAYLGIYYYTYP